MNTSTLKAARQGPGITILDEHDGFVAAVTVSAGDRDTAEKVADWIVFQINSSDEGK